MRNSDMSRWFVRVTAWLGLVSEVTAFLKHPLNISDQFDRPLEEMGIVLFLISLISWLEASNKGLEKLDRMDIELKTLTEESKKVDFIARYGSSAVWIARLLHLEEQEKGRFPHCLAGGMTLSQLLFDTCAQKAEDFHRLLAGEPREVNLTEASIINRFLTNLVKSLPPGSAWLGISRLQDSVAWMNGTAEPSYIEFEGTVEKRAENRSLTYLRILCFESDDRCIEMLPVATHQANKGLDVRICLKKPMPEDISLIWVPKGRTNFKVDVSDPIGSLDRQGFAYESLCGIRFDIRANREVFKMDIISPRSDEFTEMRSKFEKIWAETKTIEEVSQRFKSPSENLARPDGISHPNPA